MAYIARQVGVTIASKCSDEELLVLLAALEQNPEDLRKGVMNIATIRVPQAFDENTGTMKVQIDIEE